MENTKDNKKILYIMIVVAIAVVGYIAYAVINKNNTNTTNTMNETNTGPRVAQSGDIIVIDYSGKLENGTEFDSSYKRGQPLVFQLGLGQVIAGWDEGLLGVKKGDKKTLTIPAEKAYGSQEIKDPKTKAVIIPANSTLIFDVEVVEVISKEDAERMMQQEVVEGNQGTTTAQ